MSDQDNPKLIAEINPTGENMELAITVEQGGKVRDRVESDLSIMSQNQYSNAFERPILTLLTLAQRERQEQQTVETDTQYGETELEDLPADV